MKYTLAMTLCIAILVAWATSSAQPAEQPAAPASQPHVANIRKVDFKNFTYPILPMTPEQCPGCDECTKPGTVTLAKGKNKEKGATLGRITYVDVTGDKAEEALVIVKVTELPDCLRGPDAPDAHFYLYTLRDGRPHLVWQGGPQSRDNIAQAKKRSLVVEGHDGQGCLYRSTHAGTLEGNLQLKSKKKLRCM